MTDFLDDVVRGLLYSTTGRQELADETMPIGAAISLLDATEAAAFAQAAHDWCALKTATTENNQGEER